MRRAAPAIATASAVLALASTSVASAARAGPALDDLLRAAKAARSGDPAAVQGQYELGRLGVESLAGVASRADCRARLAALRRVARGSVLSAEGFDRQNAAMRRRGDREIASGTVQHGRALVACPGRFELAPAATPGRFPAPLEGEAFFGDVRVRVPAGASAAELRWRGRVVAQASDPPATGWTYRLPAGTPIGRGTLEASFLLGARRVTTAATSAWLLPRAAGIDPAAEREDATLSERLAAIADGFPGYAGMYVRELRSGRTGSWNDEARFPAASTVKLGVLAASLRRFGPRPEASLVSYDLRALTGWSSNLAANRLLRALGRGDIREGQRIVEDELRRLGTRGSTYPGEYRVGTAHGSTPTQPPLVSARTTTARDLGRALVTMHAAAVGSPAQRAARLTRHEARVGLALLLDSESSGDNIGLVRPWVGRSIPIAQKHGWISSARHSAAIVYAPSGPVVVVLVTYREGLSLRQAQQVGRKVVRAGLARPR